jgi:alpha-ribazole phosphatase
LNSVPLHLLRHGETVAGPRYCGATDVELSVRGWEQMRGAVAGQRWDLVFSSPLQRCAAFAQLFAAQLGVPCTVDPDLREMGFGAWEGLTSDEVMRQDPESLGRFWSDPEAYPPPQGERLADLRSRVVSAVRRMAHPAARERVLAVTHGGPIRVLEALRRDLPASAILSIDVPHAALIAVDPVTLVQR